MPGRKAFPAFSFPRAVWRSFSSTTRPNLISIPSIKPPQARHFSSALDPPSLAGRECLITGASRGIGRAIAQRFAAEGAICTVVGRNQQTLDELLESLPAKGQVRHRAKAGDVGDRAFWEMLAKELKGDAVGGRVDVDVLVNAAGVTHYSLLVATRQAAVEEVVRTNLMGTMWGCQVMVKGMVRRRKGCIINVASLLGVQGGKGNTAYAASKAGIIGLTRALATEVGQAGVRVNAILPGYIETQMTRAMTPESKAQALNAIPLGRFGLPEEVADAAVFLARNEYASNSMLNLDGGLSAG